VDDIKNLANKFGPSVGAFAILGVLAILLLSRAGCGNHHTPAGFEGYIKSKPLFSAAEFIDVQTGPTSTGWVWRQEVVNIDIRPRTYSEQLEITTRNGLKIKFRAHAVIALNEGTIQNVVEKLGGEDWYRKRVAEVLKGALREKVQSYPDIYAVKNKSTEIAKHVKDFMATQTDPEIQKSIVFKNIYIGEIRYPTSVVKSVITKLVTSQESEKKNVEAKIALKRIEIREAEADGIKVEQEIISKTLDPMFIQYEALSAVEQLAGSPNTTFLVVPFTKTGGAPLIMNLNK